MTEAEMFEMLAIYTSNAITIFNSYVSFVFAYLAVAYFVGNRLSPLQLFVVTTLFVIASIVAIGVCELQIRSIEVFQHELALTYGYFLVGDTDLTRATAIKYFTIPVMIGGVFASLFFMFVEYREGRSADR